MEPTFIAQSRSVRAAAPCAALPPPRAKLPQLGAELAPLGAELAPLGAALAPLGAKLALLGALLALLCACQARAPRPDVSAEIAAALGPAAGRASIELSIDGMPLDAPGAPAAHVGLAEALERALSTDAALQAALARVELAAADADQARLLANPVLDLVLRFPDGGGATALEASLGQDLLSYLTRPRRIAAADRRLAAAAADCVGASLDAVAGLRERYAAVQALDELAPLLAERRRIVARLAELERARLAAGESSRLDVLALEARESELELELAEGEAERAAGRLALARALGAPSLAAVWTLEPAAGGGGEVEGEAAWVRAALERRPELAALRWELAALGDEAGAAGFAWLEGSELGVRAERDGGWSVGPTVALPLPLFDTGGVAEERARAAVLEARAELLRAEREAVEDVRRAHAALLAARAALAHADARLVPLQRERRAHVAALHEAGEADSAALLAAEDDLQAALARRVGLARAATLALVRLERAVGGAGVADGLGARAGGADDVAEDDVAEDDAEVRP